MDDGPHRHRSAPHPRFSWSLEAAPGGTRVTVTAANVPAGISAQDHATGLVSSLEDLDRHLASRPGG